MTPSPRTIHQNAIAVGPVEPKGKGATATVTNRITDEILFDDVCMAFVTFNPAKIDLFAASASNKMPLSFTATD